MAINSELYIHRNNFFYKLDPITKLIISLTLCFFTFLISTGIGLAIFLITLLLFFKLIEIPSKEILTILKVFLPLSLLIILCWPLFQKEFYTALKDQITFLNLFPFINGGIISALRLLCLCFASFLTLLTIDQTALIRALVRLGLPYSIGLSISLALRFIPTLYTLFEQVKISQKARGFDLDEYRGIKKIKPLMPILIAVIVSALKMGEDLSHSLETRGLGLNKTHSSLRAFRLKKQDICLISLSIFIQLGLILFHIL